MDHDLLHRRRFLQLGGLSILSSVGLAACTSSGARPGDSTSGSTSTTLLSPDVGVLRLASSLEHYAVGLYMTAAGSGLLKTASIVEAVRYFADQHSDHARFYEAASGGAGGRPVTTANPAVAALLKPRVDALQSEADFLKLAYDVEAAAAATYFSAIGGFKDRKLNAAVAGVQGIEARHVAVLGTILTGLPSQRSDSPPYSAGGFQTTDGAIAAGTGV